MLSEFLKQKEKKRRKNNKKKQKQPNIIIKRTNEQLEFHFIDTPSIHKHK